MPSKANYQYFIDGIFSRRIGDITSVVGTDLDMIHIVKVYRISITIRHLETWLVACSYGTHQCTHHWRFN